MASRNWLTTVFNSIGLERRTSIENPQTPLSYPAEWLLDIFNGGRTDSGIRVSEMTALQVGTVYACVNTIANGVSTLPLHVYEHLVKDKRQGKRIAYEHILWELLHNEPNPEMTTHTWLKVLMVHCLLWGNGYCEIQRDKITNQIVGLWPRNPARTRPIRNTRPISIEGDTLPPGTLMYETTESLINNSEPSTTDNNEMNDLHVGTRRIVLAEDMLHIPGLSLDGRLGQSTVYLSRQIMGLALATEKYGAKFFGNGARPAGILTIPNKLEDIAVETLRRSWAEAHGGENQFKVAILEAGVKFEKIASTPDEGQMNATRQYQRSEICAVFGVPLHMVAAADKGGGKSNVEQQSIEFVLYCLNPWLTALQQEFGRKLFPKMGRSANRYFALFDKRKLLYPDADSRGKFYSYGRQWGFLNANDIREMEDMNPIVDGSGDIFWAPVNMQPSTMPMTGGPDAEDHLNLKAGIYTASKKELDTHQTGNKIKLAKASPPPVAPPPSLAAAAPAGPAKPAKPGAPPAKKAAAKKGKRALPELGTIGPDAPDLYIMRHGTTDANEEDLYRGWGDFHLDADGITNATAAGQFLKDKGIKRIVTSSLARHAETAQIVTNQLGKLPVEINEGFKTLNVGDYAGKKRSKYADDLEWYLNNPEEDIPGGESLDDFVARSNQAFDRERTLNKLAGPTLIITSRSNIAGLKDAGTTGAEIKVANPGGIYRLDATNNLELIYGKEITDTLAGT